jgi:endoglucanase
LKLDRNIVRFFRAGILALVWSGCSSLGQTDLTSADLTSAATPAVRLHGANLVGMEGTPTFDERTGPIPDVDYAVHSTSIIDYLAGRNVNVIRFLFSWERMQSALNGDIPAASSGNYKTYFDDYMRIVDYATNVKSMTVIVTPWQTTSAGGAAGGARWRGDLVGAGRVTNAHFADFWSKMATAFRDHPRVAIGLVTEPNRVDTMRWFATAQDAISAIRSTGFDGEIYVPGNGWTAAGSWEESWYDTGSPQRSNAYGWLNARGVGQPLADPLEKLIVEVHTYADDDAAGSSPKVVSSKISRARVSGVVDWARANHLKVFIGEIGMYARAPNAPTNWMDFVQYMNANTDTVVGYAWWGCGKPGWWDDVGASNGGHFSITPTNGYTVDTVNMRLLMGGATSGGQRGPESMSDGGENDAGVDGTEPSTETSPTDAGDDAPPSDRSSSPKVESEAATDGTGNRRPSSSAKQSHSTPEESSPRIEADLAGVGCSAAQRGRANAGLLGVATALAAGLGARRRRRR